MIPGLLQQAICSIWLTIITAVRAPALVSTWSSTGANDRGLTEYHEDN